MKTKGIIVSLLGVAVAFLFQNCGNGYKFSSINSEALVRKVDVNTGDTTQGTTDTTTTTTTTDDDKDKDKEVAENDGDDKDDSANLNYMCILDGPGQSAKLGYVNEKLIVQNAVPQAVCTTENACLTIVSEKFQVKTVVSHGDCLHNKNVVHLTEAQVSDLISAQ